MTTNQLMAWARKLKQTKQKKKTLNVLFWINASSQNSKYDTIPHHHRPWLVGMFLVRMVVFIFIRIGHKAHYCQFSSNKDLIFSDYSIFPHGDAPSQMAQRHLRCSLVNHIAQTRDSSLPIMSQHLLV